MSILPLFPNQVSQTIRKRPNPHHAHSPLPRAVKNTQNAPSIRQTSTTLSFLSSDTPLGGVSEPMGGDNANHVSNANAFSE
jgi:hypothetical protein